MITTILESVRQVWHFLEIPQPMPDSMQYVLQSRRRVIFFLFAQDNAERPLVVVKLTRDPTQNSLMKESVHQAQHVRTLLDETLRTTVPAMSLLEPVNGLLGVAEKALPGFPVTTAAIGSASNRAEISCSAFAEWLALFQSFTQTGLFTVTRNWIESIFNPLEKTTGMERQKQLIKNLSMELVGLEIPLVWAYGDAHPSNILLLNERISGVVDWEGVAPDQWPIFDWFQFVLSLAQELIKAKYPQDRLQRAIMACTLLIGQPDTQLAATLQQQTRRFISHIGLEPELALPLFLLFLIRYYWFDDKETLVKRVLSEVHKVPS